MALIKVNGNAAKRNKYIVGANNAAATAGNFVIGCKLTKDDLAGFTKMNVVFTVGSPASGSSVNGAADNTTWSGTPALGSYSTDITIPACQDFVYLRLLAAGTSGTNNYCEAEVTLS